MSMSATVGVVSTVCVEMQFRALRWCLSVYSARNLSKPTKTSVPGGRVSGLGLGLWVSGRVEGFRV